MPEMWITTVNPGKRSTVSTVATSSLNTMGTTSRNPGKGEDNQVDVVETNRPSEAASTMLVSESGDADESMNLVKPGTEAWRPIHSRTRAEHCRNDQWVTPSHTTAPTNTTNFWMNCLMKLKEQKHTDNQRHELQPVDVRLLGRILGEVS